MKKKNISVLLIGGAIILVLLIIGLTILIRRSTPSKDSMNLYQYYNITDDEEVAVIYNDSIRKSFGAYINGHVYLDYEFVHEYLNSRFYWDHNENVLLYTTSENVIMVAAESSNYSVGKSTVGFGNVIVKATSTSALIDIDFLLEFSNFNYEYHQDPSRVTITGPRDEKTEGTLKKTTALRYENHIKSPILTELTKASKVSVLDNRGKWSKICTTDGIVGYVKTKFLKNTTTFDPEENINEENFSHITMNTPVNLLWHQVTNRSDNGSIADILTSSKGVNVMAPTWFKVADNSGNISTTLASKDYVDYCHNHGVQVWGLVSDFEIDSVDISYILTHTSARQNLVNQLVSAALQYNLDGINIDFESTKMTPLSVGDGYIQFIRELSIKCENNDIILSTDVRIPAAHNSFYQYKEQANFVDYIILMAYDEHWYGCEEAGSVASLKWVENAVNNTLAYDIPSNQIVLGMPFYTRIWYLTPQEATEEEEIIYTVNSWAYDMDYAKNWLANNVAEPVWLEDCGQWYGECTIDNIIYKIWLEDTTSLEKRLQLMDENHLGGAAFWRYGFENKEAWELIIKYVN